MLKSGDAEMKRSANWREIPSVMAASITHSAKSAACSYCIIWLAR